MKGSKGLYVFTISEYEDTDSLHIQIGTEEAYIPLSDIYDAASNHKQYLAAKARIDAMPEEERIARDDNEAMPVNPELERRFTYHPPKDNQPQRYERIRFFGKSFAEAIDQMCPNSREKSLAWTALEECVMWANAAIARNE